MQCYKIRILQSADKDLDNMLEVLSEYSPNAALKKYDSIMSGIEKLKEFPLICEVYSHRKVYRRMVVDDYLVFYKVNEKQRTVNIYRILYGAGGIPEKFV